MIDYGRERGSDVPPKVSKVIDYGHGDYTGAVGNDRASFSVHPRTSIPSTSSKSSLKYTTNL